MYTSVACPGGTGLYIMFYAPEKDLTLESGSRKLPPPQTAKFIDTANHLTWYRDWTFQHRTPTFQIHLYNAVMLQQVQLVILVTGIAQLTYHTVPAGHGLGV